MLPQLRKLEKKYDRRLAVVGVHSPKFIEERETESVHQAIKRLNVGHPVVMNHVTTGERRACSSSHSAPAIGMAVP